MRLTDPLAAVTASDPYPFYAALVRDKPIYRNEELGFWVAASAEVVTAVLTSDLYRVRPPEERVPRTLLGSPAGELFSSLVRMSDPPVHCPRKRAVSAALDTVDAARVRERSETWAERLVSKLRPREERERLNEFLFQLPLYVVADLLGVPEENLPPVISRAGEFARGMSPASGIDRIEQGKQAVGYLLDTFRSLLDEQRAARGRSLLSGLAASGEHAGLDEDTAIANGIGFLAQAYEATAGLIGNTLLTLATHPKARDSIMAEPDLLDPLIQEVLRYDSPVQNTRRFVAADGEVAGQKMRAGDTILLILAAANRDPAVNPELHRFDIQRKERRLFTFGTGAHACPGTALASLIAGAGIRQLIASGLRLAGLADHVSYRPSVNTRIPTFAQPVRTNAEGASRMSTGTEVQS